MDLRDRILDILEASRGRHCSGEKLCKTLNLSRAAVWKHIEGLRDEGYAIEAAPSKGYWLAEGSDVLSSRAISRRLNTCLLGKEVRFFRETTSTNAVATALAAEGVPEGTLVVTEAQTSGKGRLGRQWLSPAGCNLYFSLILRPPVSPRRAHLVTIMASVALAAVLRREYGIPVGIKWPNDILMKDRKLAGLLTELKAETDRVEYVVLGVGINVNWAAGDMPKEISSIATSVSEAAMHAVSRLDLLAWFLEEFENLYLGHGLESPGIVDDWRSLSCMLGRTVRIRAFGRVVEGVAENVDDEGRLLVNTGKGIELISAGDVEIL